MTRLRIELWRRRDDPEPAVSGWATHAEFRGVETFTLDNTYPGVMPAPGWVLTCDRGTYAVTQVVGGTLAAAPRQPDPEPRHEYAPAYETITLPEEE